VDETQAKAAGLTSDYDGKTYYFCSYTCNKQFDKDPASYVHKKGHAEGGVPETGAAAQTVKDPVCSLEVATEAAKRAGRTSDYQGKTYYFDTDGCKQRFDYDPKYYLHGSPESTSTTPNAYPPLPTNPDLLLRLRRDSIRAIPEGKNLAPVAPQGPAAAPGAPPGPTPPMGHPGGAQAAPMTMPHGGAQVTPPAAAPQTPPLQPQAHPSPPLPPPAPEAAQPQPPKALHTLPPGPGGHQHD
jgi:YHS domain-containing protein